MSMNDFMYGSRAKIGLINPSAGWIMEPEFYAMSPTGVATYTTRISLNEVNAKELLKIEERAIEAINLITEAPVDVIAVGCTSGSFINGTEYNKQLVKKLEKAAGGIPCTTTGEAVVDGLKELNTKKVAVATPYIDEINSQAKIFF